MQAQETDQVEKSSGYILGLMRGELNAVKDSVKDVKDDVKSLKKWQWIIVGGIIGSPWIPYFIGPS